MILLCLIFDFALGPNFARIRRRYCSWPHGQLPEVVRGPHTIGELVLKYALYACSLLCSGTCSMRWQKSVLLGSFSLPAGPLHSVQQDGEDGGIHLCSVSPLAGVPGRNGVV